MNVFFVFNSVSFITVNILSLISQQEFIIITNNDIMSANISFFLMQTDSVCTKIAQNV